MPWFGYYEFSTPNLGNLFGAKWYSDDGTASVVDSDPAWKAMFQWQHDFIANVYGGGDFQTGADKLQRFVAGAGDEFSSANDFEAGRTAMNFDGEWRTAFIADEVPDLPYATAPYPVPDDMVDTYGSGPVGGTIIGIPKGSPHPDEAWLLLEYMATDTDTLVYMANNVRNVPTTHRVAERPRPGRDAAVPDVPGHLPEPGSHYKEPSAIGASDQNILAAFVAQVAGGQGDGSECRALRAWRSRSTTSSRRRRSSGRNVPRARP